MNNPNTQSTPVPQKKVRPQDHPQYGLVTLACFVLPPLGLVLGIINLLREDAVEKKLGEHAVTFSILTTVLWVAVILLIMKRMAAGA